MGLISWIRYRWRKKDKRTNEQRILDGIRQAEEWCRDKTLFATMGDQPGTEPYTHTWKTKRTLK